MKSLDKSFVRVYTFASKLYARSLWIKVTVVRVGENENLESAIKRFKRKCQKDGIIGDIRKKEAYKKPSVKKKEKREAARKRARKRG